MNILQTLLQGFIGQKQGGPQQGGILDVAANGNQQQKTPWVDRGIMSAFDRPPANEAIPAGFPEPPAPYDPKNPLVPAQAQAGQNSPAPAPAQNGGGFMDRLKSGVNWRDFGDRLQEGLVGLGQGRTLNEGLGMGAAMMNDGNLNRRGRNQTVDWLVSKGVSADEAKAAARNPAIMQRILTAQGQGMTPLQVLQAKKMQLEIDKMGKPGYTTLSADEAKSMGLPPQGVYQRGPDGKVGVIGNTDTGPKPPHITTIYDEKTGMDQKVQWDPKTETYKPVGGQKAPSGMELSVDPKTGQVTLTQGNKKGKDGSDYGKIPPGYEMVIDPETKSRSMRAIPGSPADTKAAEAQDKKNKSKEVMSRSGGVVVQDVDRALKLIGENPWTTTGIIGSQAKKIPGTVAHDVDNLMTTIRANATFDNLQQMRDSSPTGGALGSVSDNENKLLGAAFGALEQSQSQEQLEANLKRVRKIYLDIIHGEGNWSDEGEQPQGLTPMTDAAQQAAPQEQVAQQSQLQQNIPNISTDDEYDSLPSGAQFIDPDGNMRRKP